MKNFTLPLVILLLCYLSDNAQYVSIEGKQFKLNGNNYYPMIMNYSVEPIKFLSSTTYYITAMHSYGSGNNFECTNDPTCNTQMQNDFNYISGMGFNGLRIAGFYPKYIAGSGLYFYFSWSNQNGQDSVALNPTNSSDPGMQLILPLYDSICSLASATTPTPLKIIFIMSGTKSAYDATEVSAWSDFLAALATHFNSSVHNDALFAYDLMNEPCYGDSVTKTKQEACEIVRTWYDSVKTHDTHHLVTIGTCGISDVFSYDPAVMKLDFMSLHFYPDFKPYEDRTQSAIQQAGRNRTANDLYWFNQASPMPWIVGETGFEASAYWGISDELYGTLTDMGNYSAYSLDAVCNCGASGYSWWSYQDVYFSNPGDPGFGGNFFGLLERGGVPSTSTEKQPAVNNFRNYTPGITGSCPVDYSLVYDASKLYYNRYTYPSNTSQELSSTITDQNSLPIKNAVIGVNVDLGQDTQGGDHYDYFFTHTDTNGYFKAIPYDFEPIFGNAPGIAMITISTAGAERLKWGWCPGCITLPSSITLNKTTFSYDNVINNETVLNGETKYFQGWNSLTASTVVIQSGGTSELKARNEIHLLPGFEAHAGSDVHIYIAETFPECIDYSSYLMQRHSNTTSSGNEEDNNKIELDFKKYFATNSISVFPNPTNGLFTVQLNSNDEKNFIKSISIYDVMSRKVYSCIVKEKSLTLDLSLYPKGLYFIQANDSENMYNQKIVVH